MGAVVVKHRFTVEEYHKMREAGLFTEDDRVELIAGEIVEMTPISSRHAACVKRLNRLFPQKLGERALVSVQDPIRLGEHAEPQPDLALLKPRKDFYSSDHPGPQDIFFLVEVAETSTDYDREVKLPLYARAGIPEVWLVDLERETIAIYGKPSGQGYQEERHFRRGQGFSSSALPGLTLTADEVLG
ncbi:MAG: Uma2 family endonuclease [Candidatus Bipolaricaulota bacterium]